MFGKKPSAPPSAPARPQAQAPAPAPRPSGWAAQALTADYVASGYLAPIDMPLVGFLNVPTQATITLNNAQLQALGPQAVVVSAAPPEVTILKSALIAFIPRDEAGMRAAAMQMPQRAERAILYAGPYLIRAALMVVGDMPLRNFFGTAGGSLVAATEAEITCQMPGAKFSPLKASLMVLNKSLVQMYHAA